MNEKLTTNLKRYQSPAELSLTLGISVTTIYSYTSKKLIPYIKIGRLVKFDMAKIENWLKQKSVNCISDYS